MSRCHPVYGTEKAFEEALRSAAKPEDDGEWHETVHCGTEPRAGRFKLEPFVGTTAMRNAVRKAWGLDPL